MFHSNKAYFADQPIFLSSLEEAFLAYCRQFCLSEAEAESKLSLKLGILRDQLLQTAYSCIKEKSRIGMQRICNETPSNSRINVINLYQKIQQSHEFELLQALPIFSVDNKSDIRYRSLIFLGSQFLATLLDASFLDHIGDKSIANILIVETSIEALLETFCFLDIDIIKQDLKSRGIILDFIYHDTLDICMHLVYKKCVDMPHYMLGSYIVHDPDLNSRLAIIRAWIFKPQGLSSRFVSAFGYTTDEINQSIDAFANYLSSNRIVLQHLNPNNYPIAIVGSGPSLSDSLSLLAQNQNKLFIVSAGSSIGPLLKAGIQIDMHVVLERGDDTALDFLSILGEYPQISNIPCFRSSTSAPVFSKIFHKTIFFHRPLSAAFALTLDEEYGILPICGPESINAAFDLVLALGFRQIYLFGADFSALSPDNHRCESAIGLSPRILDIVELSTMGRSVLTDRTLISTRDAVNSTASLYSDSESPVAIFRVGEGLPISGEQITHDSALNDLAPIASKSIAIDHLLSQMNSACVDLTRVDAVLEILPHHSLQYFNQLKSYLLKPCSSPMDRISRAKILQSYSEILKDPSASFFEVVATILMLRLFRQVSLFMIAVANDHDLGSDPNSDRFIYSVESSIEALHELVCHMAYQIRLKTMLLR